MYYTIEGKRFLAILYIAGLLMGTLFLNITIRMNLFKLSDFLDFTEYMKMLRNMDLSEFCTYVFFIRIRQLVLFFLCLFLFSPYVVFCILDLLLSVFTGMLISVHTLKYGLAGGVRGILFLFPHFILYGAAFAVIYVYLFRNKCIGNGYGLYRMRRWTGFKAGQHTMLRDRIMVVLLILFLFLAGCASESFVSPWILRKFLS